MKYHIITYGCQMNKSDSERIATILEKDGYNPAKNEKQADLIVVNMCSIRQSAVDRVFGLTQKFKKLKTTNYELQTILTGCILKKDRKKFAQVFDLALDIRDLSNWPKKLAKKQNVPCQCYSIDKGPIDDYDDYLKIKPKCQTAFTAFVPIMTGCNNFCSYCVVPYVRGREISRPAEDIINEVKKLVKKGYKEITLLGQNVNSYRSGLTRIATRKKAEINFPKLLKMINNIPGNFWLRFITSHPKDMSDKLIETMAKCQKVCEYVHLPVQSGDNQILKKMNRHYTISHYKNLIKKIRTAFKKYRTNGLPVAISTDIIVGFPVETKKQFENTAKLMHDIKFDMAYIAKYSPRPGTAAAKMEDSISPAEKKRREKVLTQILKKTALENNKKYIGKTVQVLIDYTKPHKTEHRTTQNVCANLCSRLCQSMCMGKTRSSKTVKIKNAPKKTKPGEIIKTKITDADSFGLKGELST